MNTEQKMNRQKRRELERNSLNSWLKRQPGSTRRGVARGKFQLPPYVIMGKPENQPKLIEHENS